MSERQGEKGAKKRKRGYVAPNKKSRAPVYRICHLLAAMKEHGGVHEGCGGGAAVMMVTKAHG